MWRFSKSWLRWPADEGELLELVNIVLTATRTVHSELNAEPLTGAACEPYHFLGGVR